MKPYLHQIESNELKLFISEKGAEAHRLILKNTDSELLWDGNPNFWNRQAPHLFPIVGKLKNNQGKWNNQEIRLSQHGFLRDLDMTLAEKDSHFVRFQTQVFQDGFPFKGTVSIEHSLLNNQWITNWKVKNEDEQSWAFSAGHHPAFRCGIDLGWLEFEKEENFSRILLEHGLFTKNRSNLGQGKKLELKEEMFLEDAVIFDQLASEWFIWKNKTMGYQVKMNIKDWPWLGIWKKPEAPFLCLEPWKGHADYSDFNGDWKNKEGLITIQPKEEISFTLITEIQPI